jgi:hypothetical protein
MGSQHGQMTLQLQLSTMRPTRFQGKRRISPDFEPSGGPYFNVPGMQDAR